MHTTSRRQAASICQLVNGRNHVLAYLRRLARGGGYELAGVRGWATAADVGDATGLSGAGDDLRAAVQRRELVREDVSVPDATAPVWVYRITDDTARKLAELEGGEHIPIQPPNQAGPARVYLRPGVAVLVDALRDAFHNSTFRRARIPGEPEWRTCRELSAWLWDEADRTGVKRSFLSDDLQWAVKNGLIERRELPPPPNSFTSAPVVIYRLTVTGAAVHPLVWHEPDDE
jgi:hypothetical protein